MRFRKPYFIFFYLMLGPWLLLQQFGCAKDYSFEGADTLQKKDSIIPPVIIRLPGCLLCKETDALTIGKWSFKNGNTYACGGTDNAGFIGTNTTFTFFGPSACSTDTGVVMTVYLPIAFNEDRFNVVASQAAFYYYDHNGTKDIFLSRSAALFTLTVQSYIHATRVATGIFEGTVFKPNGDTSFIRDGRFKVKLK